MQTKDSILFMISEVPEAAIIAGSTNAGLQMMEKTQVHEPVWYFIYLFVLLGIYAYTKGYYGNLIIQTYQSSINFKVANRMFKNIGQVQNQLDLVLYPFYVLSLGFLLYYLERRTGVFPYGLQGGGLLLFNFALLTALFVGRVAIHTIAGLLFNSMKIIREYLFNMFIYNKLVGLLMLPLTFLLVYTGGFLQQVVLWTSIVILLGILVLRLIRGLQFSYKKDVLIFYMFLYLCALEIAPLVLLYRWLKGIL